MMQPTQPQEAATDRACYKALLWFTTCKPPPTSLGLVHVALGMDAVSYAVACSDVLHSSMLAGMRTEVSMLTLCVPARFSLSPHQPEATKPVNTTLP